MSNPVWRKMAQVQYTTAEVKGKHATLSAINPLTDEQIVEKQEIDNNDGTAEMSFPWNYEGDCEWEVTGSAPGSGTCKGHFTIPSAAVISAELADTDPNNE